MSEDKTKELDAILDPAKHKSSYGENQFTGWYRSNIEKNRANKELLVKFNPELAQRVYAVFSDTEIAGLFVATYKGTPEQGHNAYLLAQDLGLPVQRPQKEEELQVSPFHNCSPSSSRIERGHGGTHRWISHEREQAARASRNQRQWTFTKNAYDDNF